MRIDKPVIAGIQTRHVVVVVEAHQRVGVRIGPLTQEQGRGEFFEAGLFMTEYRGKLLFQREIQHADAGIARPGMPGDLVGVVIEGFAEHEKARAFFTYARHEGMPEAIRHPADGIDAKRIGALLHPLQVCAGQIIQHRRIVFVEVGQFRQAAAGVVEGMQWVVLRIQLRGRKVLVVGDQPPCAS